MSDGPWEAEGLPRFSTVHVTQEFHSLIRSLEIAITQVTLASDGELLDPSSETWRELCQNRKWLYEYVEGLETKARVKGVRTALRFL